MSTVLRYRERKWETRTWADGSTYEHAWTEDGLVRCDCGAEVVLDDSWANPCPRCHVEYNGAGQKLAPRRFWGEETGEQF
jgi:hypothetical protein